jgi:branched-chain amino acid transport system substrate-binding protein
MLSLLALPVLAAGCGGGQETATTADKVKIGGIFDITGGTGDVGEPYARGARACVEFLNSKGGVNGRQIDLKWEDYAYDIKRAKEIYDKLVGQEKVVAILGWGTGDTEALKSIIARDKIPYISGRIPRGCSTSTSARTTS